MLQRKNLPIVLLLVCGGLFLAGSSLGFGLGKGNPPTKYEKILHNVGEMLSEIHYSPKKIDDNFSREIFKKYLGEKIDDQKNILLQSDIQQLKKYETKIDDEILGGSVQFVPAVTEIYKKRLPETEAIYLEILSKPFDFTKDESANFNDEKLDYPKNEADRKEAWRKRLKYMTLERYYDLMEDREKNKGKENFVVKTDEQLEQEARDRVLKILNRNYDRLKFKSSDDDRFNEFVKTITESMDPHTTFMPPVDKRYFDEEMSGRFYGIGASLREEDGNIKIGSVLAGSLRAGVDSRGKFNGGGDINVRQGKINVFANAMYNQRKSKGWGETDRTSFMDDKEAYTKQYSNSVFNGAFAFGRFGLDYFIDNRNTISIAQSIVNGDFKPDNRTNSIYDTTAGGFATQYRNTTGKNNFRNYGTQLSFKHLFAKAGKEWTADLNFNQSKNTNLSDIRYRSFYDIDMHNPNGDETLQTIDGGGENRFFIAQTDYVNPVTEKIKWEAGLRAQVRKFESYQHNFFNTIPAPALSNDFEYTDHVYAGYVTYSQKIKESFSYQLGLRAESSGYDGKQIGKDSYENDFPISLFPSVFLSKTLQHKQDLQLNYTRRINRPNFFQLMPNTDYSDPLNYQTGNPALKPEFTHSLELSYQKTYGKANNTFLATLFGKYTTDLISRYQYPGKLGNFPDSVYIATYVNASTAYASGLELIFRNTLAKWWDVTTSTNIYYSKINGSNIIANLENERTSWSAKMNHNFKFNKGWSVQISGDYQGKSALPVSTSNSGSGGGGGFGGGGGGRGGGGGGFGGGQPTTTQGYINANYGVDMGLRKDIAIKKNTATISVNWSDVFRTRRYFVHSEAAGFVQDDWRRRDPQIVRLNFSYRFGKFDASLFKRKNLKGDAEGMQNGMQGIQQ